MNIRVNIKVGNRSQNPETPAATAAAMALAAGPVVFVEDGFRALEGPALGFGDMHVYISNPSDSQCSIYCMILLT